MSLNISTAIAARRSTAWATEPNTSLVNPVRPCVVMAMSSARLSERFERALPRCGPPHDTGDSTRLEQVVRNLLDNAAKYSPMGTAIDVSVEDKDALVSACRSFAQS